MVKERKLPTYKLAREMVTAVESRWNQLVNQPIPENILKGLQWYLYDRIMDLDTTEKTKEEK